MRKSMGCLVVLLFVGSMARGAADLECGSDPATDAYQCFRLSELKVDGDLREARLYRGGPKQVRPTSHYLEADCRMRVLRLRDRDGVAFGGGPFSATAMSRQLGDALCAADPKPGKKR